MGTTSKIAWTHATFNCWRGCQHATDGNGKEHPACHNCYAERQALRNPAVLGVWGDAKDGGVRVCAAHDYWKLPLKWNADAEASGVRKRVFCASLADVFEEWGGRIHSHKGQILYTCPHCGIADHDDQDGTGHWEKGTSKAGAGFSEWTLRCNWCSFTGVMRETSLDDLRRRLFKLIDATPWLDWLLLTKRPENVRKMWIARNAYYAGASFRQNVWLGTSISDQRTADVWIPRLIECRGLCPVLFLSIEPLLGDILLRRGIYEDLQGTPLGTTLQGIDMAIVGCESKGRYFGRLGDFVPGVDRVSGWYDRALYIVEQCRAAGVAPFVKQIPLANGLVGHDPDEWPEGLRVQEFPYLSAKVVSAE